LTSADSITGLELSERFYFENVKPILGKHFPDLKYSSGLIGSGSEVLGFDDVMSQDHHWGPRMILFLPDTDYTDLSSLIDQSLKQNLSPTCHGFSTNFSSNNNVGERLMERKSTGEINHFIEIVTIKDYFNNLLGVSDFDNLSTIDWLSFPRQILLSIQSGKIFQDDLGLNDVRGKLNYYPNHIWLYIMASSWKRIGQEEHLAARCMLTDQEIGFSIIASRLIKDIMQLGFLLERKYAPYAKWLEKSFAELNCAKTILPYLNETTNSPSSKLKWENLCKSFEYLASIHNDLSITKPIDSKCKSFHTRPFDVIHGEQIADIIVNAIDHDEIKSFAGNDIVGSIDQISDNTDIVESVVKRRRLIKAIYGP